MSFQLVKNITIPTTVATRNRPRGEFAQSLDALEVGDGGTYTAKGSLKSQYPRVAPKKFGGAKRFKLWVVETLENGETVFGVARIEDKLVADAIPGVNTVPQDDGEYDDGGQDE